MPSQISITRKCQLLEHRREQLRLSVLQQQQQNRDLLLRHNLLQAWCECLSLIQVNKMEQHCANSDGTAGLTQEFERLLEAEAALLNQLTSSPACSLQDAAGLLDVGMNTIAPAGDPMAYFKHHISQPPMANAATMTRRDMAELMRESTLQLSVQLHILQESPPDQHAAAIVQLQAAFDRVVHASMSLVMVGREDLVESANFCNLQTLEPDCDGATRQAALTATLIDRMNLTAQQQHMVATGSAVYLQLLNSTVQERQRLQSQFAMADSKQAASVASSGGSVMSESSSLEDSFKSRQQLLEAQNKQAARLQLLIRKEMMLRMAGMTWFVGCLSWTQLAKACVLCWPYTLRPSLLCQEIQKRAEAEQSDSTSQQQLVRDQSAAPTSNNACC